MTKPEITQEHIDIVRQIARYMTGVIRWRAFEDLEHDGLMGLYTAWDTWKGEVPFDFWARRCIRWAMLRYADYERRHRDAKAAYLSEPGPNDVAWEVLLDAPDDVNDLVFARIELQEVLDALTHERPMVVETVLRLDTDTALAKKYGRADSNSMRQIRKRFLRDFLAAKALGQAYRSTGRDRPPVQEEERASP